MVNTRYLFEWGYVMVIKNKCEYVVSTFPIVLCTCECYVSVGVCLYACECMCVGVCVYV